MQLSPRLAVGLVCLLHGAGACGRSPEAMPPKVELAAVRECGSIPSWGHIVTVQVTQDGDLYVPGRTGPQSLLGLHNSLRDMRFSRDTSEWERDEPSTRHLVLEIDRRTPWPLVAGIVQVGLSALVEIRHFWFVVRSEVDGAKGAIAYIWSGNFGINPTRFIQDGEWLDVWITPASGHTDFHGIHERIASLEEGMRASAMLQVHRGRDDRGCASWGDLAGVFDAVLGAGVHRLVDLPTDALDDVLGLWHAHMDEQDALRLQRAWVASHRPPALGARIRLAEEILPTRDHVSPRMGGSHHAGAWGWTGDNVERHGDRENEGEFETGGVETKGGG